MICRVKPEQLHELAAFAWQTHSCRENACFPKMFNSEADVFEAFERTLHNADDRLLAMYRSEALCGVLRFNVEKSENYAQSGGIFIASEHEAVYTELIAYLRDEFPGFYAHFGYPTENMQAQRFFDGIGAERFEESVTLRLNLGDWQDGGNSALAVERVTEATFGSFARFHDEQNPDMYWTSSRMRECLNKWHVYAVTDARGDIVASMTASVWNEHEAEIFSLSVAKGLENAGYQAALLEKAMPELRSVGKRHVVYFVDMDSTSELNAALKVGFVQFDTYVCFRVLL